jgi:hypothetical protein
MLTIEEYKQKKDLFLMAQDWANKIGKPYSGGGGGFGCIRSLEMREVCLYYQEYDGAKNYYPVPVEFIKFLERAIIQIFPDVLKLALEIQQNELQSYAAIAIEDARNLLNELQEEATK